MNNSKIADLLTINQLLNWIKDQIINDKISFDDTIKLDCIKINFNNNINHYYYKYKRPVYINNKGQSMIKYKKQSITESIIGPPDLKLDDEFNSIYINQSKNTTELKSYLEIIFNDQPSLQIKINEHYNIINQKITTQRFLFKKFEFKHILSNYLFSFVITHGNYRNTIAANDNNILLYNEVYDLYSKKEEEYNNQQQIINADNSALLLLKRLGYSK